MVKPDTCSNVSMVSAAPGSTPKSFPEMCQSQGNHHVLSSPFAGTGLFPFLTPSARFRYRVPNLPIPGDHMHDMCE